MVTVIVPVYNTERYLDQCLKSIAEQTYEDLEIILINDGSTDGSAELCKKWAKADPRICLIDKENEGQGAARSQGIEMAKGRYILFVDSDDYLERNLIERIYGLMEKEHAEVCIFSYREVTETKKREVPLLVKVKNGTDIHTCRQFLSQLNPTLWTKMYAADLLKSIPGTMENTLCEDLLFLPAVLQRAKKIVTVSDVLYNYRNMRSGNMSTSYLRYHEIIENVERLLIQFKKGGLFDEYWKELYYVAFDIFKDILFRLYKREGLNLPQEARDMYPEFLETYEAFFHKYFEGYIDTSLMQANYLLIGSYNLRVIIRGLLLNEDHIVDYYGASSVVSLMSQPLPCKISFREKAENQYRRKQILRDINKEFEYYEKFENIDYIVVDLLEEAADLLKVKSAYITESEFMKEGVVIPDYAEAISLLDEERRDLFMGAASKLIDMLRKSGKKVLLAENYLNTRYSDFYDTYEFYDDPQIEEKNRELKWCYDCFCRLMPEAVRMNAESFEQLRFTYKDFLFGCVPENFNSGYYKYMALEIGEKVTKKHEQTGNY